MSDALFVGLDIGGTSTRALVASADGTRLGAGQAGGGNPTSHDPPAAAASLRAALDAALHGLDPALVRGGVVGLAGVGKLAASPTAAAAFESAWRSAGLRCPYRLVSDALVGYASGAYSPDGTVLVAGTGAIAAAVRGLALDRVVDGHGWLLGDLGSGFWLGREAARAALAVFDGAAPDGPLAASVRARLLGAAVLPGQPRQAASALVQAVNGRPPVRLADLAPLVFAAYGTDPVAERLVATAADHLVATLALVHGAVGEATRTDVDVHGRRPVVLAGGLLTSKTPLAGAVRARIAERWPDAEVHRAGDGAAAAVWLAIREQPGADPVALHGMLLSSLPDLEDLRLPGQP